jgi:hypothetical protein
VDKHEHALVVELAVLIRLDAQLVPGHKPFTPALCHTRQPVPASGCWGVSSYELDLFVCPLDRPEVTALPSSVDRADQFHVLL